MPRKTRSLVYSDDIAGTWLLWKTPDGYKPVSLVKTPTEREYWRGQLPDASKEVQEFNAQLMTRGDDAD